MKPEPALAPKSLSASEYILALFEPGDEVAILTRNRRTGRTVQRIATAETIAGPQFQTWLQSENIAGADIFIGMNPIKNGANGRTKENIREIRHLYLDLDTGGQNALDTIRKSLQVPTPNFVLDTSPDRDFQLQEDSPETPGQFEADTGRTISPGHRSQSEQDWAYAKRALARGDDPAIVIQRIADFRADDKPDPEYYARYTVRKAEALLRSKASRECPDSPTVPPSDSTREP